MKKQIVLIHGGETFETQQEYVEYLRVCQIDFKNLQAKKWKDSFAQMLGEDYEVIQPRMPNALNAKYAEWKIWFEKFLPILKEDVVLIGHSLGGIFLARYLSENIMPVRVRATILIAAPYDAEGSPYSLADFVLPVSLEKLDSQGGQVYIIHSKDDSVVKFEDAQYYVKRLPSAHQITFENRDHFSQETFPELVTLVKDLTQ